MNTQKILFAWLMTVFFGSGVFALLLSIISARDILYFLISMIISALFSLPTLIVQLVVNAKNSRRGPNEHIKAVNRAHFTMFLVTLLIGNIFIALSGEMLYILFTGATLVYALVAVIIWFFILKMKSDW